MKNTNTKGFTYQGVNEPTAKQQFRKNLNVSKEKLVLLVLSFVFMMQLGTCQQDLSVKNKNMGFAVSSMIGPDGFGIQYLPSVYYKKNRSYFYGGIIIQKQKLNVSGAHFNYEYTVVREGEADSKRLELFFYATGLYQANALLSKRSLYCENLANPENASIASEAHFKSVEVYGGFGLRIKLFKNVKWINSIGAGGYTNFNSPNQFYYATYSSHQMGFMVKTGISIDFKK